VGVVGAAVELEGGTDPLVTGVVAGGSAGDALPDGGVVGALALPCAEPTFS
jgi:hypothetical protein